MTKIILRDGSAEWSDDVFKSKISEYGDVIRVEKEMIFTEGIKTCLTTGAQYVYVSKLTHPIPPTLEFLIEGKLLETSL